MSSMNAGINDCENETRPVCAELHYGDKIKRDEVNARLFLHILQKSSVHTSQIHRGFSSGCHDLTFLTFYF